MQAYAIATTRVHRDVCRARMDSGLQLSPQNPDIHMQLRLEYKLQGESSLGAEGSYPELAHMRH